MVKKRIIGVLTILEGKVVQSFGYKSYLPLGSPESIIENLDRWGVDEILIQCIDRSKFSKGPDYLLLDKISSLGIGTPIIYSGGIKSVDEAVSVIKRGADRISLQDIFLNDLNVIKDISSKLGSQALIASITMSLNIDKVFFYNYISKKELFFTDDLLKLLNSNYISEILLIDWKNDGGNSNFNSDLIKNLPIKNKEIILFGGISDSKQISELLGNDNVSAVGIGNYLNYKEHAFQNLKREVPLDLVRTNTYYSNNSLL